MGVARSVENGTSAIHRLRSEVHALGGVIEHCDAIPNDLPCLVKRAPSNDARMGIVSFETLQPLRHVLGTKTLVVPRNRAILAAPPVAKLSPHDVSESICVVEESLLEYLLVKTRPVEASRLAQFDVPDEMIVGRRRHPAFGVPALVKD